MSARHILRGCSVVCAVWFAAFAIIAAAEKPDFTGRWRIELHLLAHHYVDYGTQLQPDCHRCGFPPPRLSNSRFQW